MGAPRGVAGCARIGRRVRTHRPVPDHVTGRRSLLELPPGDATSEPAFVPRAHDAEEGDGWVLAVVWRGAERRSELLVLRADAIQDEPMAIVGLPQRVPFGFHGNWEAV